MSQCNVCLKQVLKHAYQLKCNSCKTLVHLKCLPNVTKEDSLYIERHSNSFYCTKCLEDFFPFNYLDHHEFLEALSELSENRNQIPFELLNNNELIFSPFDLNEDLNDPLHEIDPDIQFYKDSLLSTHECNYHLEDTFNNYVNKYGITSDAFSIYMLISAALLKICKV